MCVLQTAHLWLHLSPEYFASSPLEQPWYFVHLGYLLYFIYLFLTAVASYIVFAHEHHSECFMHRHVS